MKKYCVSDRVSVFIKKHRNSKIDSSIRFLFNDSRIMVDFVFPNELVPILKQFDGNKNIKEIISSTPHLKNSISEMVSLLKKHKILIPKIEESVCGSTRHKRQINFFGSFESLSKSRFEMQDKLRNSTVGIIGLGGIGSWVVEQLARSGVGKFIIIDPDIVDNSNLSRQAMYTTESIGKFKVDSVEDFIKKIDQSVSVDKYVHSVVTAQDLNCFAESDLIINSADFPDTDTMNLIVTEFAILNNISHILCGGYNGHHSYIGSTVIPNVTPCWNCYILSGKHEKNIANFEQLLFRESEIEGGTLAPIAISTASIHALEAIKVLTGFARPSFVGKMAEYDFLTMKIHERKFRFNKNCIHCKKQRNE